MRLSRGQSRIARVLIQEGRRAKASRKEIVAALETGLVEANLTNPRGGSGTSVGWRQETAESYPNANRRDVRASARRFYSETRRVRNKYGTAGELSQAVQRSAFPGRYQQRRGEALSIYRSLGPGLGAPSSDAPGGGGAVTSTREMVTPGGTGAADLLSALSAPPAPRVPSGLGLPEPAFSARARVPMPQTPLKLDVPSSGAPEPPRDFNSLLEMASKVQGGDVPHTTVSGGAGGAVSDGGVAPGGSGRVKVAGSANRAGHGIQRGTMRFLQRVAGDAGETITVGTGTNHNRLTVDGNVSDHWDGHAADIPVPVDSGQGDHIAAAALMAAGVPSRRARTMAKRGGLYTLNFHGHRIQVIWKTNQGGNHHNHVHVGYR